MNHTTGDKRCFRCDAKLIVNGIDFNGKCGPCAFAFAQMSAGKLLMLLFTGPNCSPYRVPTGPSWDAVGDAVNEAVSRTMKEAP